ncbi:MAG: hypothetical protein HQM14_02295 [SAR324 cluster bacterium]|nr:hypothetical protein [SAR324 cluster bacterium]
MIQAQYQHLEGDSRNEVQDAARKILEDIGTMAAAGQQAGASTRKKSTQRRQERRARDRRNLERRALERRDIERRNFAAERQQLKAELGKEDKKDSQPKRKVVSVAVLMGIIALLSIALVWWSSQSKLSYSAIFQPSSSQYVIQQQTLPVQQTQLDRATNRQDHKDSIMEREKTAG